MQPALWHMTLGSSFMGGMMDMIRSAHNRVHTSRSRVGPLAASGRSFRSQVQGCVACTQLLGRREQLLHCHFRLGRNVHKRAHCVRNLSNVLYDSDAGKQTTNHLRMLLHDRGGHTALRGAVENDTRGARNDFLMLIGLAVLENRRER